MGWQEAFLVLELVSEDSVARAVLRPGAWNQASIVESDQALGRPPLRRVLRPVCFPACYHWARGFLATRGWGRRSAD